MYDNQGNKVCSLPLCQYGTPCNNDSDCATGTLSCQNKKCLKGVPKIEDIDISQNSYNSETLACKVSGPISSGKLKFKECKECRFCFYRDFSDDNEGLLSCDSDEGKNIVR